MNVPDERGLKHRTTDQAPNERFDGEMNVPDERGLKLGFEHRFRTADNLAT